MKNKIHVFCKDRVTNVEGETLDREDTQRKKTVLGHVIRMDD